MQKDLFDQEGARGAGSRQCDIEDLIDEKLDPLSAAMNELYDIGAPVIEHTDGVYISGEDNHKECWADYWEGSMYPSMCDDFGVNHKINAILEKHGLFAEWQNPGLLAICEGG